MIISTAFLHPNLSLVTFSFFEIFTGKCGDQTCALILNYPAQPFLPPRGVGMMKA